MARLAIAWVLPVWLVDASVIGQIFPEIEKSDSRRSSRVLRVDQASVDGFAAGANGSGLVLWVTKVDRCLWFAYGGACWNDSGKSLSVVVKVESLWGHGWGWGRWRWNHWPYDDITTGDGQWCKEMKMRKKELINLLIQSSAKKTEEPYTFIYAKRERN